MLAQQGEACDVLLVTNERNEKLAPSCSDFVVQFNNIDTCPTNSRISISVNGSKCPSNMNMKLTESKGCRFIEGESLKPPSTALASLVSRLQKGKNTLRYSLLNNLHQVIAIAEANLYLWEHTVHILVCDVDGTITKSNARGVLDTIVLESYAYSHDGVCEFLSHLLEMDDSLRILYLTSRPLTYAQSTRKFLQNLRQNVNESSEQEEYALPPGPLFMHPGTLSSVLYSELVSKDVHIYKSDALLRQVVLVFAAAGRSNTSNLLISGFGNALTDSVAYETCGISRNDIYMIDKKSQINCMDKDGDSSPIRNHVQLNSQGSLEVLDEESSHSNSTATSKEGESQESLNGGSENGAKLKSSIRQGLGKRHSSRQLQKSLHRQYSKLIGSSYSGYHDSNLWRDVTEKIQATLELSSADDNV